MEVKREKESFTMKMVRRPMKVNSKGIICTGKDLSSIPKMDLSFSKVPYSMAAYSMAHFFIDFINYMYLFYTFILMIKKPGSLMRTRGARALHCIHQDRMRARRTMCHICLLSGFF